MKRFFLPLLAAGCVSALPTLSQAAPLYHTDFNAAAPAWPGATAVSSSRGVSASVAVATAGTVDVANTDTPSPALRLTARPASANAKPWSAALVSGLLPVQNAETSLAKLTLAFSLSAPSTRPVTVRIASFDAARKRTGGLRARIFPAAPGFMERYALDLDTFKAEGGGRFDPTAPSIQFSFEISGAGDAAEATGEQTLCVDNVSYASPAFYVSPKGSDARDGKTEKTAFATPQKALDVAQPGDIVLLMEGTYKEGQKSAAAFVRPGAPDAWIVLKNYPNQTATLTSTGWNIVSIAQGSKEKPSDAPALAYLEVRGLRVRGEGDVAKKKYPEAMNIADSRTNSNGIAVDGRYSNHIFHDIRIADNVVEYAPGCGIGSIDGDWITVENNICRGNCWTTIYAPSGISVMGSANFDTVDNVYKRLVRNNICSRNETFEKWHAINRYSDGNGIILDVNQKSDAHPDSSYIGRTLVQSNLCFDNGGSGIHTVTANRVDIIGNTAYLNSASKNLEYSEIFTYGSQDVRIMNNILVAPVADVAAGEKPEPVNRSGGKNARVVFAHNLYWGGNVPPTLGDGDVIADPQFVRPSRDPKTADFHLKSGSPAIGKGIALPVAPYRDLDNKPRKNPPTEGVYEK